VTIIPPKFVAVPTAMQLAVVMHETPNNERVPEGADFPVHPVPPDVVSKMVAPATAVQVLELMQETPESGIAAAGVPRSVHVDPPLTVLIAWDPTARQVVAVGHEIASRAVMPEGRV